MPIAAGTRFGLYEIRAPLGAGGMGEVYRARDSRLGRDVAIKVLSAPFAHDPERLVRFEREARLLASLNHPSIGAIYGVEQASLAAGEAPTPALILELVEGDTLADRLRRGPIAPPAALAIARLVADALDVAHERGIVHRDLKPANIKVSDDNVVKVLDFGLAKALAREGDSVASVDFANSPTIVFDGTREGVILGTPAYMSPEQARGKAVDKRADIWAFGCVLYEMLAGVSPFKGETAPDTLAAILEREPDLALLPAATPAGVRKLLRRCLEKDPRRRLRDIADARVEIEEAIASPASSATTAPPFPATLPHEPARRRGLSFLTLSLLLAALAAALLLGRWAGRRSEAANAPAFDRMFRLVATAAHEFGPAISPDGKWVAYLSNARGPTDVWVKFVAGGDPVNLTAAADVIVQSQDYIGGLAVSPDGSEIAFGVQAAAFGGGASWVIPAPLGGAPRKLLSVGNSGLQWSRDGKQIAYVRTGGPLGDAVMVADADGQNEREIVRRQGARHAHWLRWDSTGKFVYFNYGFQNANSEPTEIFRAPVAPGASGGGAVGSPERVVATARRAVSPLPAPDGRGLFYAANPDGVDLGLWWRSAANERDQRVTTGVGEYTPSGISADGRRLVGTVVEVREALARVPVSFDRPVALAPLTDGYSGDIDPVCSPDGTRLVFSSSRAGHRTLWTARADLSQPTPLTSGPVIDLRPAVSPDGRQIAFVSDRGGERGIWLVSADAGAPRRLAATDVIDTISWSPDGRRIVYSAPIGDAPGLRILEVATGESSGVPIPGAAAAPAWSPRGDQIAYIEPRGGTAGTYLKFARPDGQVVYDRGEVPEEVAFGNGSMAWSPDGARLAVEQQSGAFDGAIWIVEPGSSHPYRKLLDLPSGVRLRGITWSRDGASLVVGRIQRSGDIFLAERSAPE
ncbi:MAG: protein kinase [Thermoanaerobaculia bacterium]